MIFLTLNFFAIDKRKAFFFLQLPEVKISYNDAHVSCSSLTEQVLSYIKSLEARVLLLEAEKQQLSEIVKPSRFHPEGAGGEIGDVPPPPPPPHPRPLQPPPYSLSHHLRAVGLGLTHRAPLGPGEWW